MKKEEKIAIGKDMATYSDPLLSWPQASAHTNDPSIQARSYLTSLPMDQREQIQDLESESPSPSLISAGKIGKVV